MTQTEIFLIAMLLIFVVPYLIWRVGRTEFYAPLVVVQIICGILLGPGVMGAAFPDYYSFVFNPQTITGLNAIAWWAVMIFVWIAGVELNVEEAWKRRRETGVTAGLALVVPLITGSAAAILLLMYGGNWIGDKGAPWQFVIGIGMACAVTALHGLEMEAQVGVLDIAPCAAGGMRNGRQADETQDDKRTGKTIHGLSFRTGNLASS